MKSNLIKFFGGKKVHWESILLRTFMFVYWLEAVKIYIYIENILIKTLDSINLYCYILLNIFTLTLSII